MKRLWILLLIPFLVAAAPTRQVDYTTGTTIRADDVTSNENEIFGYLQTGVDTIRSNGLDAIGEIDSSLKSGSDQSLVTGTAGSDTQVGIWNSDGDIVGVSGITGTTVGVGVPGLAVTNLVSCDTIDTDANGVMVCGDDGGSGGGAPTDADYLVGTANATLSAEIVAGTSPQGELGGTWGSPTIDDSLSVSSWTLVDPLIHTTLTFEETGGTDIMTGAVGGIGITGGLSVSNLISCDTIDTDASGVMSCGTDGGGGSGAFSDSSDPVVLNTTTKDVNIGTTHNNTAKLSVDGDADQIQFSLQGHTTQTSDLFVVEDSGGTDIMTGSVNGIEFTKPAFFGAASEWAVDYDDDVDDQLLVQTSKVATQSTTSPMLQVLVGTTPTADQQVFGVAKGTQASNTDIMTIDEDGDMVIAGGFTSSGTGQSSLSEGLVVNDSGGSGDTDDFRVESNTEDQLFVVDAGSDQVFIGDFDSNYISVNQTGVVAFVGSAELRIPNSASETTDAAGEIKVDTTDDQLKYYGGAERVISYKEKIGFVLIDPVESDGTPLIKVQDAITVTDIECIADPAGSGDTVGLDVYECDANGDSCTLVEATISCANTSSSDDGTIDNASIDASDWLSYSINTITGTVTGLTTTIYYTIDAE